MTVATRTDLELTTEAVEEPPAAPRSIQDVFSSIRCAENLQPVNVNDAGFQGMTLVDWVNASRSPPGDIREIPVAVAYLINRVKQLGLEACLFETPGFNLTIERVTPPVQPVWPGDDADE